MSHKQTIAAGSVVTIETCDCGVLHLNFGAVSMRFTTSGLEDLHETIMEALVRVQLRSSESRALEGLMVSASRPHGKA